MVREDAQAVCRALENHLPLIAARAREYVKAKKVRQILDWLRKGKVA